MNWQPIESAPKDRPILLIGGYVYPEIGDKYNLDTPLTAEWQYNKWWAIHTSAYSVIAHNPTHWCEIELPKED
jgi:hypothetical protein